jgi:dihydrodipicolinate synthase/N-acetylneuraminate lyase
MSLNWDGIYCALWTPTDEQGRLMERALEDNLDFLKCSGVQGLLPLGSTGEFPQLSPETRRATMEKVAQAAGPLRLMMNISDIRPSVVAELGRCARQVGAAAVSLLPPSFFPVAQEDLVEFFVRGAEAAQLPLFLYNFPERTGNRIALETVAAVVDRVPVAGIKQSGNEFGYHSQLVALGREKGFIVLTGADTRLSEAVALGVSGCVSGLSNAVPDLVLGAFSEAKTGAPQGAAVALSRMTELARRIPQVEFPLDVAAVMEARGRIVGSPKRIISNATQARYDKLVAELRTLFQQWKLI